MRRKNGLATVSAILLCVLAGAALAGACGLPTHTLYAWKGQARPHGNLVWDAAGNFYGTTDFVVFKLTPKNGTWAYSNIYLFGASGPADGVYGNSSLIFDAAGNLYGTTEIGGAYYYGTVFKLEPTSEGSWTETVLYSFTGGSDGAAPYAGLILDSAGNLYGTTEEGGMHGCQILGCGVVFKLAPNADGTWSESVLHSFTGGVDGGTPLAGLVADADGNFYGTTLGGGESGGGTAFRLSPDGNGGWVETVLHSFHGTDGMSPSAGLVFDSSGNLYGTSEAAGAYDRGVVFKLAPQSDGTWAETVLHAFKGSDGSFPQASLVFDSAGNLYGTTWAGGDLSLNNGFGLGVVFKLAPEPDGTWTETVLHHFYDCPGAHPFAGVILDRAGHLFGTTYGDQVKTFGSVFEIVQ